MYGMSAKERLAKFENKNGGDEKTTSSPAKKKIGKLNIPGQKDATANSTPKKPVKKVLKKKPKEEPVPEKVDAKKDVEVEPENVKPVANEEANAESKQVETPKEEVSKKPAVAPKEQQSADVKEPAQHTVQQQKDVAVKQEPETAKLEANVLKAVKASQKEEVENSAAENEAVKPKENVPVKKDVKPKKDMPVKKDVIEDVPVKKDVKSKEDAPVKKDVKEDVPVKKDVKPKEDAPVNKAIKAKEDTPVKKDIKPKDNTPVKKDVKEDIPVKNDVKEEAPVDKDIKAKEDATVKKDVKAEIKDEMKVQPKPKEEPKVSEKVKEKPKVDAQVGNKTEQESSKKPEKKSSEVGDKDQLKAAAEAQVQEQLKVGEAVVEPVPPAVEAVPEVSDSPQKSKVRPLQARMPLYKAIPEEFYDTLFYFSGMGTVVGSALNEGVFVPQRATKTALETKVIEDIEIEKDKERQHETYLIRAARRQAFDIADELRKLQGLLTGMPHFGQDKSELHRIDRKPVDNIMHARYHIQQADKLPQKRRTPPPAPKAETSWPPAVQQPIPQKPAVLQPDAQWPPTVVQPAPLKESPIKVESNVGVFKGVAPASDADAKGPANAASIKLGNQPWQQKYGTHGVANVKPPEPFHQSGQIPGGLKPWQLSRLRGLEVQGYHFTHDQPDSGADHSDSFYHGHTSVEAERVAEDVSTLAPFLVSSKSQRIDRQHVLATADAAKEHHFSPSTMNEYYGIESDSLPYHDL